MLRICHLIQLCVDDETPTPPDPNPINLTFTGVQMTDYVGQLIGCYGDCDDDWTNIALTTDESGYLASVGDIFNATPELGEAEMYPIYPNPI